MSNNISEPVKEAIDGILRDDYLRETLIGTPENDYEDGLLFLSRFDATAKAKTYDFFKTGNIPTENINYTPGTTVIIYDPDDSYSVVATDAAISTIIQGYEGMLDDEVVEQYAAAFERLGIPLSSVIQRTLLGGPGSRKEALRVHFWSRIDPTTPEIFLFYFDSALDVIIRYAYDRLIQWHTRYLEDPENYLESIESEEETIASEVEEELFVPSEIPDDISYIINTVFEQEANPTATSINQFTLEAFGGRTPESRQLSAFYRVFERIENIRDVDEAYLTNIFQALKTTGLLDLASYAYEIGDFAKKRFTSKQSAQRNANDYIDPEADLNWLIQLGDTINRVQQNPILFATVQYYFPSLVEFYFTAQTVVVDYSNGGVGGAHDDENIELFYESLEQVFGLPPVRKLVREGTFVATSDRIKAVIASAPFRRNISPDSPDIFHLRLGAANFYVPPVSININTQFKTGSLTGGALRQKNSPKFNTGHRETVIGMRLFFPNYQEIWGLSLDPDTSISLNEDFEIDFRYAEDESGNRILGDSEEKIDKFLSSLRGLVAAFKYSPILPVRNQYLNVVHGVSAVALSGMNISTIPNFPFALAVDLELLHFNHNPFLPMIKDFNQAVHWGKYRQYMGKAASSLHNYVNEGFLIKSSDSKKVDQDNSLNEEAGDYPSQDTDSSDGQSLQYMYGDVLRTNIIDEWRNGNNISFYAPAEVQTKLYLPDSASFRSPQEKLLTDTDESNWRELLKVFGIDLNESASYGISLGETLDLEKARNYSVSKFRLITDSINLLTAGISSSDAREKVYLFLIEDFISQNSNILRVVDRFEDEAVNSRLNWLRTYSSEEAGLELSQYSADEGPFYYRGVKMSFENVDGNSEDLSLAGVKFYFWKAAQSTTGYLDYLVDTSIKEATNEANGVAPDRESIRLEVAQAFNASLYETFFKSGMVESLIEAVRERSGNIRFNEWEVPMIKVDLDPNAVFVNGVTVSLSNNFAKLQFQMQDEPTYQHIGGRDSYVNISMTIIGERELIKFKKLFDHISSLARLEHATGVIGFLGIKNIITALSGIKYVMPLTYSVNTEPNYPHVYSVNLSMVDFDIFQQRREELSSRQQRDLVREFGTKKNPFLRLKQHWGYFNAYPDLPLQIKDSEGNTVGHLDPDFYFRSFEMFDQDVVNNVSTQQPKIQDFFFDEDFSDGSGTSSSEIIEREIEYALIATRIKNIFEDTTGDQQEVVRNLVNYVKEDNISRHKFFKAYEIFLGNPNDANSSYEDYRNKWNLLTSFISFRENEDDETNPFMEEVNPGGYFQVGDLSPHDFEMKQQLEAALSGAFAIQDEGPNGEDYVSFHPDQVDFHKIIFLVPANSQEELASNKSSAILVTAAGNHFGYIDRNNGRFYLTVSGSNVLVNSTTQSLGLKANLTKDVQTPDTGNTTVNSGIPTLKGVSEYQKAYSGDEYTHWEKMMVDTSYRDVSGRMLRAFPSYMLWLIDEGGYFAGVKLFDNFYGLQSIIDFSVISSEDILGDTLVFRVSNMYSKLTTPESSKIFNTNTESYQTDELDMSQGLGAILERTLNMSMNLQNHMSHQYVVDINNIRLKPGVRVHLRGGYGSNPNSLQTLFNGIITNVEQGEIVTVTAQSDAIELGAMVNSTNKKGDSGKIDGGVDTGLWLSEPRDLMVRLLSMGASRTREAISRATLGTVFSENRFGIRHFGNVLYEPMTSSESEKNKAMSDSISGAYSIIASEKGVASKAVGALDGFTLGGGEASRSASMSRLMANMSAEVDLELFKRNIYPGNGTGIAQFLGGDLDDGWSTVASVVPEDTNSRVSSGLNLLTDITWNRLVQNSANIPEANSVLDNITSGNVLNTSNDGIRSVVPSLIGGAVGLGAGAALAGTGVGVVVGGSLTGILSGRGGQNLFKTMGVISPNADDDLDGFDEVSFKAQTYMRTVWDMFQLCARLLPNYIVAVRPFEDRSTIFYGKPHWLYTSGVVPVTTGYTVEEGPAIRRPDNTLQSILDSVNRETNSLADYGAFLSSTELSQNFASLSESINNSTGIYSPTSALVDKLINFRDSESQKYRDPLTEEVVSQIPLVRGNVDIGFHLPVGKIEEQITNQSISEHRQVPNLPLRYQYPFFTNSDKLILQKGSTVDTALEARGDGISKAFGSAWKMLRELDDQYMDESNITLIASGEVPDLDTPLNMNRFTALGDNYYGLIDSSIRPEYVQMPFPDSMKAGYDQVEDYDYFELDSVADTKFYNEDWGAPETPEDEQFYIAMRWPYNPSASEVSKEKFKSSYGFDNLYGTASDYKQRKVLVYNPINNRAVVCKPAYFFWGESTQGVGLDEDANCVVSPDAAYFLGIITNYERLEDQVLSRSGFRETARAQNCFFAFVPDSTPVGVVSSQIAPANRFALEGSDISDDSNYIIGFGVFGSDGAVLQARQTGLGALGSGSGFADIQSYERAEMNRFTNMVNLNRSESEQIAAPEVQAVVTSLNRYVPFNTGINTSSYRANYRYSGNVFLIDDDNTVTSYMNKVIRRDNLSSLGYDELRQVMLDEYPEDRDRYGLNASYSFTPVFTQFDETSINARAFYDENFSSEVSVIAGNGRSVLEAQDIWDQFRYGYHNYDSVKQIFSEVYGMDPDSELDLPDYLRNILRGSGNTDAFQKFSASEGDALDEFALILGEDFINRTGEYSIDSSSQIRSASSEGIKEAIEFVREVFIDAPSDEGGLIETANNFLRNRLSSLKEKFFTNEYVLGSFSIGQQNDLEVDADFIAESITTPKQLFLFLVGAFRQALWSEPTGYGRAWLVLKPDARLFGRVDNWSFQPVDAVFREFINPYKDYAKNTDKFKQLLVSTKSEGNSSSNILSYAFSGVSDFFSANVGPIFSAVTDGLSGLLAMFKLSMQQMGYALSQAADFRKHAHVMNKALNDSIYYSLGREGSILRAVDNPFTREYGEPVIEVREPFQRIHYLNSFSHILSNQIQENISGVATTVTAVSDGKYPVTVALDKGAPAERQVEKTVETGLYYDNMVGSGFFGFLHPLMHPLETVRGVIKNVQGAPDELSARRVALAHLKESIKDIYGGELLIIGNSDIRPHDLVYIADVYERMYGLFEVEQVIHHFTSDMGFVTSITPNALVTVNDPSRWFLTSWLHSWLSTQAIRNDTRIYLENIRDGDSAAIVGGSISVDRLSEMLTPQIVGGIQFTHGSSAIVKDVISLETAKHMPNASEAVARQLQANGPSAGAATVATATFGLLVGATAGIVTGGTAGLVAAPIAGLLSSQLAWGGWKWVRDNLLDQHGCYVQYLNKNGQPMDAGLSYNQGMVVGQYHSKALLPGILGVRSRTRTPEGNSHIRSDDLFKSLGWRESEITELTRYISYENALVHARVLGLSGVGPDRASLEEQFKVLVKVTEDGFIDGDTLKVKDIISGAEFRVRFNGINTAETNVVDGKIHVQDAESEALDLSFLDISTPGGRAKEYVRNALQNKVFVLRINKSRSSSITDLEYAYDPGSSSNAPVNYQKDIFGRELGVVFYYIQPSILDESKVYVANLFRSAIRDSLNLSEEIVQVYRNALSDDSVFWVKFNDIYDDVFASVENYFPEFDGESSTDILITETSENDRRIYSALVYMRCLESVYQTASSWPITTWDSYYENGYPVTLNWELVVNNLARVYVADLQTDSQSVQTAIETLPIATQVETNSFS